MLYLKLVDMEEYDVWNYGCWWDVYIFKSW